MANAITMSFSCSFDDPGAAASFMDSLAKAMERLKTGLADFAAPLLNSDGAPVPVPVAASVPTGTTRGRPTSAVRAARAAMADVAAKAGAPAETPLEAAAPVAALVAPAAVAAAPAPGGEPPVNLDTLRLLVRKIASISSDAVKAMATALGTFEVTRISELKESDHVAAAEKLAAIVREHTKS